MKDMNKVKGSTQKTTTITNAREENKIVTLPLEQRNINVKDTSKLHTLELKMNNIIGHFKTKNFLDKNRNEKKIQFHQHCNHRKNIEP